MAPRDVFVQVQQAIRGGATLEELFESTKIDPWFLDQMFLLDEVATRIRDAEALTGDVLAEAKRHGFSDRQIAAMRGLSEDTVREVRGAFGIHPVYKTRRHLRRRVRRPHALPLLDLRPGERGAPARARGRHHPRAPGPNRIGQGIEFDYSCVHAAMALREHYETIMVNCNPETVSTDYDISEPPLLRAAHASRTSWRSTEAESADGPGQGRDRPARRPDAAVAGRATSRRAGVPILGTSPRVHRPGREPRAVR